MHQPNWKILQITRYTLILYFSPIQYWRNSRKICQTVSDRPKIIEKFSQLADENGHVLLPGSQLKKYLILCICIVNIIISYACFVSLLSYNVTLTLTGAIMSAGVAGWAPSLIQKARRNTSLNSSIANFRHEWHV